MAEAGGDDGHLNYHEDLDLDLSKSIESPKPSKLLKIDKDIEDHEEFVDKNPGQVQQQMMVKNENKMDVTVDKVVADDNDDDYNDDYNGPQINPFLLDPVLKVIMSQMTIDDLKKCRGVCTLWDHQATQELQKLTCQMKPQNFTYSGQLVKFVNSFKYSSNQIFLLHKIKTTSLAITIYPNIFQNFKPKSLILGTQKRGWSEEEEKVSLQQLIKILQNCSENIKEFHVKGIFCRQLGGKYKWPQDLKFPQLEQLKCDLEYVYEERKHVEFIIKNVLENAPKLKSFFMMNPSEHPICHLLSSCGIIENLKELGLVGQYTGDDDGDLVIVQDLMEMAETGLKLTKLTIRIIYDKDFACYLKKRQILAHLKKLKEFLTTQSETLVDLKISINFEKNRRHELWLYKDYQDKIKFTIPPLPKLKVLEIEIYNSDEDSAFDEEDHYCISFNKIDLPTILPNLKEIIFDLKSDYCNFKKIFHGSIESVKKIRVKLPVSNVFSNFKKYRKLIKYFPCVIEFEMDQMDGYKYQYKQKYEHIPWETTLKKLTIHVHYLHNWRLKFGSLSHLKGLERLELTKEASDIEDFVDADFDFESLSKTTVKSLKIQNYLLHVEQLEKLRSRYTLDYPVPLKNKYPYTLNIPTKYEFYSTTTTYY